MATNTAHYNIIKPDYTDPVDVQILDDNYDLIDNTLYGKANLVDGKVPASELPSYVDDIIEGYYYNGAFYSDSGHSTPITGETGKIYVDLSTNKQYRWSGSAYVQIAAGAVEDVQNPQGNSLVNNGIAVIPVTDVTDENGNSLVDASGTAIVQNSALYVEFTESSGDYSCDTDLQDMFDALDTGREVIGQYDDGVYYVGNYDESGEYITFYSYSSTAKISELFGSGILSPTWTYDEFSLTGGGGGQLPTATNLGDIPSWNPGTQLWEITHKGTITSGSTGYAIGGDVFNAIGNVEAVLAELIGGNS